MSQSEGQRRTASKRIQPFKKKRRRDNTGIAGGMKEWSGGNETQEDESLAEIQRHQRTERIRHKCWESS